MKGQGFKKVYTYWNDNFHTEVVFICDLTEVVFIFNLNQYTRGNKKYTEIKFPPIKEFKDFNQEKKG